MILVGFLWAGTFDIGAETRAMVCCDDVVWRALMVLVMVHNEMLSNRLVGGHFVWASTTVSKQAQSIFKVINQLFLTQMRR